MLVAEIGALDLFVDADRGRHVGSDHAAIHEHGDAVGKREHCIHVVLDKDDPQLEKLLRIVKEREARGYSYDGAEASFVMLARHTLGTVPEFFEVESYRASVERRHNAKGQTVNVTEAVVKIIVDGERLMSVAEGNGPVNALDLALRKDLGKFQSEIADLELVDFKVRILDGGTGAVTRVLVESRDGTGERLTTIGVNPNIIDASFEALYESITYKLLKTGGFAG